MADNTLAVPMNDAVIDTQDGVEYDLVAISRTLAQLRALANEPVTDLTITTANQGAFPEKLQELIAAYNSMHHTLQGCIAATQAVVQEVYDSRMALEEFEVIS